MSEDLIAIARRAVDQFWNEGDESAADEIYAADYAHHDPLNKMRGPDGMKLLRQKYHSGFPDLTFTIEDIFVHGDKVVSRWSARGTHTSLLWHGFEPTNKKIEVTGLTISRIADGKMQESWVNWDALGMLQQVDVIPHWGRAFG